MRLTRRLILSSGAAAAAGGIAFLRAPALWAQTEIAFGAGRILALSDGNLELPADFVLAGLPAPEAQDLLAERGVEIADGFTPDCNLTLYRDGERTVLFDAGSGPDFMPSAGKLAEALDVAGLAPKEVTHVVFTHAHPDHLWGVLDDFDEPFFPEARYIIGRDEWDYWTDPATVDSIGPDRTAFAVGAARRLAAIGDRMSFCGDGEEVLPGIVARATHGHTPGHMSYEVGTPGDGLLVLGDAIANHHIAFARPGWPSGSDQDPDLGASTRAALLDRLAGEGGTFIGFHLPYPGVGRAERDGDGYRFVPVDAG